VEDILRHEVDAYISKVVREKKKENVDAQKDKNELSEHLNIVCTCRRE
jgi:hypothetical protein